MRIWKPKKTTFYWYDFTWKGERVRQSSKETTKYHAGIVAQAAFAKVKDQGALAILQETPTLAEFGPEFLEFVEADQAIESDTKRFYRHGWEMLAKTKLAGMKMDAITEADCRTAEFPGGNYTANQAIRTLSRMFSIAEIKNRFHGKRPKIETRKVWGRKTAMTTAQAALIASKMKDGSDPKDLLLIMRATGMRPKELYRARWEHVNWETGEYLNPSGKTATAQRPVPLLDAAGAILKRRWLVAGMPQSGWVFPSTDAKGGHIVSIAKAFRKARVAAGLPLNLCLYTARHGVGTELGAILSLKEVMAVLGHADSRTALGYQHPSTTGIQKRLDEARHTYGIPGPVDHHQGLVN